MVFKNVERDPAYRGASTRAWTRSASIPSRPGPGLGRREGFIFVSSPGSVTALPHGPRAQLPAAGTRTEARQPVRRRGPRAPHRARAVEVLRSRPLQPGRSPTRNQQKAQVFALASGDGALLSRDLAALGQNGSQQVSVSFSITFRTASSDRREVLYRVNERLRRVGIRPAAGGPLRSWSTAPSIRPSGPWPRASACSEARHVPPYEAIQLRHACAR